MIKYDIRHRYSRRVLCSAKIDCDESAPIGVKKGLAVRRALENDDDLSDADLSYADLNNTDLRGINFSGVNLSNAYLSNSDLRGVNFSGANLSNANFGDADLMLANLSKTDLTDTNLRAANLKGVNAILANLSNAQLMCGDLSDANFKGADFRGADLRCVRLERCYIRGAKGIKAYTTFGPIGMHQRYGHVILNDDFDPIVYLECHAGTPKETYRAIKRKYGKKSTYAAVVRAVVNELIERNPKPENV